MKLPIGIQTFSHIREDSYVYVDKTQEAHELIQRYKYVFLSRPRRFGKSLFLDTLKNIFEGNKQYFEGLYIYDKHDWSKTYPVIKISFAGDFRTKEGVEQTFRGILRENQDNLSIPCDKNLDVPSCFFYLIEQAYKKYKQEVVILIDEYDKPLLDNITNPQMAEEARAQLKAFYEMIKKADNYIRFVFLTGVSKFSKVSLFSGLNNLEDITLNPDFGNICGYTQNDVETTFSSLLEGVNLKELRTWYNGYNFLKEKVYNPFDILLFIRNKHSFENYWFATGTPSFLIKLIKEQNYYLPNLENITVGKELLDSFDMSNMSIEILLHQAGYLTIQEVQHVGNKIFYELIMPNLEVKMSLTDVLYGMFQTNVSTKAKSQNTAYAALHAADLETFKTVLVSLFASLPYQNYASNNINIYEGFYASVIYVYLASLGFPVYTEESTNRGRLDMSLQINDNIYIFEFKMEKENVGASANALQQIKEKKYYEKFLSQTDAEKNKNIWLVGIHFNEQEKNISLFEWEKVD